MIREKLKWRTHESESTDAEHGGGPTRSSVEVSVMEMERRGWIICPYYFGQPVMGGAKRQGKVAIKGNWMIRAG
jgi:hypothetical protein